MRRLDLALPLMALLVACDRPGTQTIYAPHQEGLTLGYENPQVAFPQRRDQRLQVRVNRVTTLPKGGMRVEKAFTTLQGETWVLVELEDGAVTQIGENGQPLGLVLPKGFPDRTREWTARGRQFRVLGQAMAVGLEVELPPAFNRLGTWVESQPIEGKGPHTRTFYLPDLGEVDTQELRDGKWVSVNKLVARGFTDAPLRRPY